MRQDIVSSFVKRRLLFMLLITGWIAYSLIHVILKQSEKTIIYAGFLALIVQVGFALVITLLTFFLWKKATGQVKTIFALFSISFLLLIIADANYNITVNILVTYYPITGRIAFIGFLIFQILVWSTLFLKSKPTENNHSFFTSYLPVILIMIIIFTIFFLAYLTWETHSFSAAKTYCLLLEAILQIIGFIFALLCLAITANKQIRFITAGYLIIIASNFAGSNHLAKSLLALSWTEIMWFLGLILITFGFSDFFKKMSDLKMNKWLNSLNSIQAQCAFWCFVLCMLLLSAFCGILIGYDLLKILPLQYLLSVLIIFSVLATLISSILAKVLSTPFERAKTVIDSYMNEKTSDVFWEKYNSNIYEFELLENFLTKSFEILKEKNKAQVLFECASQVAHDIRSPLTSLNMISNILPELPEEKRILIRNATQRINDIANNLLLKYKKKNSEKSEEKTHLKAELISSLLDHLISEKRDQMTEKSIELVLEFGNNTYGCFVNLEAGKFKRVLSNLINNASEAIESSGVIRVVLSKQNNAFVIEIVDNGKGIPEDILLKIKQGEIISSKKRGCGLGISTAIQNIKSWDGSYDIQSKVGEGTTFIIQLPITEAPNWFQNELNIVSGMNVVVLDDDQSIHDVWKTRFQEYLKNKQITLKHLYTPSTFIEYCRNLPPVKTLFLIDYELLGFEETGLDLIEKFDLRNQTVLVTSRYEEPAIRAKIIKLGIKIIPKNFAPYIIISKT